jgi:hypothetical protein
VYNTRIRHEHGVHIYTADGGFDFSSDYNAQEDSIFPLLLAECLIGLRVLSRGGCMIIKCFDTTEQPTLDLLWLLSRSFRTWGLIKPHTSRAGNAERYFIGKGYLESSSDIIELLEAYQAKQNFTFPILAQPVTCPSWDITMDLIQHLQIEIEKMEILVKQKLKEIKRGIDFFLRLETEELNMEEYHKFRVLVKKLKAIDFLRRKLMNNPKKLETRDMKAFFKKAGEIREYQLMLHFFCATKKRNVKIIQTIKTRIKELEQNYVVKKQVLLHEKIFRPFSGHLKDESSVEKFIERIIRKIDADIIKYKHFLHSILSIYSQKT